MIERTAHTLITDTNCLLAATGTESTLLALFPLALITAGIGVLLFALVRGRKNRLPLLGALALLGALGVTPILSPTAASAATGPAQEHCAEQPVQQDSPTAAPAPSDSPEPTASPAPEPSPVPSPTCTAAPLTWFQPTADETLRTQPMYPVEGDEPGVFSIVFSSQNRASLIELQDFLLANSSRLTFSDAETWEERALRTDQPELEIDVTNTFTMQETSVTLETGPEEQNDETYYYFLTLLLQSSIQSETKAPTNTEVQAMLDEYFVGIEEGQRDNWQSGFSRQLSISYTQENSCQELITSAPPTYIIEGDTPD